MAPPGRDPVRPLRDGPPGVHPEYSPERDQQSLPEWLRFEFRRFLKQGFNNNVALIAYTFEVSPETARLWITTERLPRAEVLIAMLLGYPAFARRVHLVVDNPAPMPPRVRNMVRDVA